MNDQQILTAETFDRIEDELRAFRQSAKARGAFLVDPNGQLMGQAGDTAQLDTTSLAALTASNVAASQAIAGLIGESAFQGIFLESEGTHIHLSMLAGGAVLMVLFDTQTSLGLVRLRVRGTLERLARLLSGPVSGKMGEEAVVSPFAEITEEDIDQLFR